MRHETFADAYNRTRHVDDQNETTAGQNLKPALPQMMGFANGLVVGTVIATETGWRAVEELACGDWVLTAHSGLQPITHIQRATVYFGSARTTPVHIPANALGNRGAVTVLPTQNVVVAKRVADNGEACTPALIPAGALTGLWGIERQAQGGSADIVTIAFADDQIVQTRGLVLLHCPSAPRAAMPETPARAMPVAETALDLGARARQSVQYAAHAFARLRTRRILALTAEAGPAPGGAVTRGPTLH